MRRIPSYRLHKASGCGVVTINGKDIYLGPFGKPKGEALYERLIRQWLETGHLETVHPFLVSDLTASHQRWASSYYVKDRKTTSEFALCERICKTLNRCWGGMSVNDLRGHCLSEIRDELASEDSNPGRATINRYVNIIRRIFQYGVTQGLVPAEVWYALKAVPPLKQGRCDVRESTPRKKKLEKQIEAGFVVTT